MYSIPNPTMTQNSYFCDYEDLFLWDYEDWTRFQVRVVWSSPRLRLGLDPTARTWNLVQSELEDLE